MRDHMQFRSKYIFLLTVFLTWSVEANNDGHATSANYKILTLSKVGGDIEVVFDLVGFEMDPAVR